MKRPLLVTLLITQPVFAQATEDESQLFQRAITHLDARRFAEAVPLLEGVLAKAPDSAGAAWNLGLAYAELQAHADALRLWERMRKLEPDNLRVLAKIVQANQGLGEIAARDQARLALIGGWRSLRAEAREDFALYCREQFLINGQTMLAFEYFEPSSPRRKYYRFVLLDRDRKEQSVYLLGSYDSTTKTLRELGELGADERVFHVDRYEGESHWTYAFFKQQPGYEVARQIVVEAVTGARPAMSSMRPGAH